MINMSNLEKSFVQFINKAVKENQSSFEGSLPKETAKLVEKYAKKYAQREWLNGTEAANYLGVSNTTFWRWKKAGKIKAYVNGDIVRYKKSDLEEYMETQCVKGFV